MGKKDMHPPQFDCNLSRYMKMSDNFFTFYLYQPCCTFSKLTLVQVTTYISMFLILFGIMPMNELVKAPIGVAIIFISIMFLIPLIIIIVIMYIACTSLLRIDIIFSKNFDTVFIGLIKRLGSYKRTFISDINSIDRFILDPYKNSNNKFILKVVYKDKNIREIFRINENKNNLEGLLFMLNQKLNSNNNMDTPY